MRYDTMGNWALSPPTATMGGGGLCGTAADFVRFAEMLRRRGELDGVRLLAPGTVDYMASNHLPGNADLTAFGRPLFSETTFDGVGFGLGMSVTIDPVKAQGRRQRRRPRLGWRGEHGLSGSTRCATSPWSS